MQQMDGVKVSVLTWGGLAESCGHEFGNSNPSRDVRLNCQKSAEVIVPRGTCTCREGPNNRRFLEFEGHGEMRGKQTTSNRRLPAGG